MLNATYFSIGAISVEVFELQKLLGGFYLVYSFNWILIQIILLNCNFKSQMHRSKLQLLLPKLWRTCIINTFLKVKCYYILGACDRTYDRTCQTINKRIKFEVELTKVIHFNTNVFHISQSMANYIHSSFMYININILECESKGVMQICTVEAWI